MCQDENVRRLRRPRVDPTPPTVAMRSRYAFVSSDLTVLLDLDLAEPADHVDIEVIQEILLRRSMISSDKPIDASLKRFRNRPTLHLVPDPTP